MLKRPSLWIPMASALLVAIWLALTLDEPFGADFAAFAQATGTLVLVAVTTSYVIATYDLAATARRQLQHNQKQREADALQALWNDYPDVARDASAVALDIRVMQLDITRDINRFVVDSSARATRARDLKGFAVAVNRMAVVAGPDFMEVARGVSRPCERLVALSEMLTTQVNNAVVMGSRGDGFHGDDFPDEWNLLWSGEDLAFPEWHEMASWVDDRRAEVDSAWPKLVDAVRSRLAGS